MLLLHLAILRGLGLPVFLTLYMAKSYFLLGRNGVIVTVVLVGITSTLTFCWTIPSLIETSHPLPTNPNDPKVIQQFTLAYLATYFFYKQLYNFVQLHGYCCTKKPTESGNLSGYAGA